jgi:hypothetical protein
MIRTTAVEKILALARLIPIHGDTNSTTEIAEEVVVNLPWIVERNGQGTTRILATAMTGTRAGLIAVPIVTSVSGRASTGMRTENRADRIAIVAALIAIALRTAVTRVNRGARRLAATSHRTRDLETAREAPLLIRQKTLSAIVSALKLMMSIQPYVHF